MRMRAVEHVPALVRLVSAITVDAKRRHWHPLWPKSEQAGQRAFGFRGAGGRYMQKNRPGWQFHEEKKTGLLKTL